MAGNINIIKQTRGRYVSWGDVMRGIGSEVGRSRRQIDLCGFFFFFAIILQISCTCPQGVWENRTETGRGTHKHTYVYIYHNAFLEVGIKLRFAERPALGPSGTSIFFVQTCFYYLDWFCRCRHIHTYYYLLRPVYNCYYSKLTYSILCDFPSAWVGI